MKINQIVKIVFVPFLFNLFSMANANEIEGLANVKFGQNIDEFPSKRPTEGKGVYELYGNDISGYDSIEVSSYGNIIFKITAMIKHTNISEAKKEANEIREQLEKKYQYKFMERSSNVSAVLEHFDTGFLPNLDVQISTLIIDRINNKHVSIFINLESSKTLRRALDAYDANKKSKKIERLKNL